MTFGIIASLGVGCAKTDLLQENPLTGSTETTGQMVAGTHVPAQSAGPIKDAYIVVFRDDVADVNATVDELTNPIQIKAKHIYRHTIKGFAATLPTQALENMRKNPKIRYIEQDQTVSINLTQTGATWGIDRTDQTTLPLDGTYTYANTGSSVDAYIFDTGIRQDHAEFSGRAKPGYDATLVGGASNDGNGHGTHVAGSVVGPIMAWPSMSPCTL